MFIWKKEEAPQKPTKVTIFDINMHWKATGKQMRLEAEGTDKTKLLDLTTGEGIVLTKDQMEVLSITTREFMEKRSEDIFKKAMT